MSARERATIWDGVRFHALYYGESTATYIRGLGLNEIRGLLHNELRTVHVSVETVRALARAELDRREPQHDRGRAAADAVRARRQWVELLPVITNYSQPGGV